MAEPESLGSLVATDDRRISCTLLHPPLRRWSATSGPSHCRAAALQSGHCWKRSRRQLVCVTRRVSARLTANQSATLPNIPSTPRRHLESRDEIGERDLVRAAFIAAAAELAQSRTSQCEFVATLAAGGSGAEARYLLCKIELDTRWVHDVKADAASLKNYPAILKSYGQPK